MGRDTNIEWCDSTINGTSGCDGCELWNSDTRICYAGTLQTDRLSKSLPALYSPDFNEVRMIPGRFAQAASWSDLRGIDRPTKPWLNGMPRCIFVGDLGDTFSRAVTDDYLTRELLGAIKSKNGQRHFWMLLTKRPRRLAALSEIWGGLPDNVMAMTTVTDQKTANARVAHLLKVRCKWRGLSIEPMLGPVALDDLHVKDGRPGEWHVNCLDNEGIHVEDDPAFHGATIHWVICGGASGKEAVPMHPFWARNLRDQCAAAGVPFFFKQWGSYKPTPAQPLPGIYNGGGIYVLQSGKLGCQGDWWHGRAVAMDSVSKKDGGRLLGVHTYNGFPALRKEGC